VEIHSAPHPDKHFLQNLQEGREHWINQYSKTN